METTNTQVTTKNVGIKYGIIGGIASVAYSTVINITNNQGNQALGWLSSVIFLIVLYFAMREFKTANKSFMTFKEGFGLGMLACVINAAISSIYTFVYTKFIDPSFFETIKEMQREEFEKQGLGEEQIEQTMAMMDKMMSPEITTVIGFFAVIILGLIISAIMAAIMKKEPTLF
jgi:hypothetical protein